MLYSIDQVEQLAIGIVSLIQPFPQQTFPGMLSGIQPRLCGTRCCVQSTSATLSVFKSRLFCLPRLSWNTDLTCC